MSSAGPRRVQLSRASGWRLPAGAVSVAHPTRWANPYRPRQRTAAANATAVEQYEAYLVTNPGLVAAARAELAGKDLACWCPLLDPAGNHLPCHADVLLSIANPTASAANRPTDRDSAGDMPTNREEPRRG